MSTSTEVIAILVMLALSSMYSAMETALIALGDVKLRVMLDETPRPPRMLTLWRDKTTDVLATILIANNTVNITISALATDLTDGLLEGTSYAGFGIPIAVGVTTFAILIVGEVVPKTFGKQNPERVLVFLPVLQLTYWLFYPLMRVLVHLTQGVVTRLGGETSPAPSVTEEQIEHMVRVSQSEGSMSPVSARLLTGIFELDDKVAREVMVPRTEVHALQRDASLAEVMAVVKETGHSRYPIYTDTIDDIVGVLYVKDYFQAAIQRDRDNPPRVTDLMRKPLVRPWNIGLHDLFADMQRERVHMAIIASEYGGVAGIVSLEDIIEEVFGPIYDEHDRAVESIRKRGERSWIAEGVVTMSELESALGTDFPDDEEVQYETVAGLLMQAAGRVPEPGFRVDYHGYRFEVVKADLTHVRQVAIERLPPPAADETAEAPTGG
ncbi:MAG: HlyC/CorC family transporter [Deltaproteobacteria bacterium]|nr:HlyC/CorC family transporter [Deltaproteobacteria bacterium]